MTSEPEEFENILVDTTPEVGSAQLAAALEAKNPAAIGRALRHDFVIVPIVRNETGEPQPSLFGTPDATPETPSYFLYVFSSTETLGKFLGEDREREFAIRRGTSLISLLETHADKIQMVIFDPAGPHAMQASAADVHAALQPHPDDDEVAWVADPEAAAAKDDARGLPDFPADGDPTASRVAGFDLPLSGDWFPISVDDEQQRDKQVAKLVKKQLAKIGHAPALRAELTKWLTETCVRAAAGGAQFLAYLLQRNKKGALALNLVLYWHELGPSIGGVSHLDAVGNRLKNELAPDAQLASASTPAGPFIRHSRVVAGAAELGASEVPLLLVDYWLEFPDKRGLCLISFSSPQAELGDALLTLADNIVLSGAWVMETPVE